MNIFSLLKYDPLAHTHEPLFDQNVHGDDLRGRQSRGIWKFSALLCLSVCWFLYLVNVCVMRIGTFNGRPQDRLQSLLRYLLRENIRIELKTEKHIRSQLSTKQSSRLWGCCNVIHTHQTRVQRNRTPVAR